MDKTDDMVILMLYHLVSWPEEALEALLGISASRQLNQVSVSLASNELES